MNKLRFLGQQKEFERKKYIIQIDADSAVQVMKTRLNMLLIYDNYKGDVSLSRPCPLCSMADDQISI